MAFFDGLDFPGAVHHERDAVGKPHLLYQDAVCTGDMPVREVAQHRERGLDLLGERLERGYVVGADGKDPGPHARKFCDTSLVRKHLPGSTTRESSREKRQYHDVLASEVGKMHSPPGGRGQGEIGGRISPILSCVCGGWMVCPLSPTAATSMNNPSVSVLI